MSNPINGRPALSDEVKKRLKPLIIELRRMLEEDLERELRRLGLDGSKPAPTPVEKLSYLTDQERAIRAELEAILAKEQESTGSFAGALEAVRREAAYTHLNRLVGLKCLELRGHLIIEGERTEAVTCRAEFGGRPKWLWTLRSRQSQYRHGAQAEELLWREGLLQACAAVTEEIGVLFDPADPYAQVGPSFRALRAVVDRLNELPEDAFRTDELLGWVYQYFQTEEKEKVTAGESFTQKLKKTKKYTGPDIATYTALYTERYMVDFLLQNSIGAYWMEMYPDSRAKEAWQYYVTPATPHTRLPKPLKEWKLLDPAIGSGHFLVVAFDLLAQLYEEERQMEAEGRLPRGWSVPAEQTARVILENNLHGIDIDLRAVQLAALALYLKAKELGWDAAGGPPRLNLVAADAVLSRGEAYENLLVQYQDDPAIQEAIRAIWHSLEHVRELGSLVRVEEEVEEAIQKMKAQEARETPFISSARDWEGYKKVLFRRLDEVFYVENTGVDLIKRVFDQEGKKSIGLLTLLSQRFDIVCTNPPYLGSKSMGETLKVFVNKNYQPGKRDLFSVFILRCLELALEDGIVAMVTQHSWMFLDSFANIRATPDDELKKKPNKFKGLIRGCTINCLAHLGEHAFSDPAAAGAFVVLFVLCNRDPNKDHLITSFRLIGENSPAAKNKLLISGISHPLSKVVYLYPQIKALEIDGSPLVYWIGNSIQRYLSSKMHLSDIADCKEGLGTRYDDRFVRCFWEIPSFDDMWFYAAKGGGYSRWYGFNQYLVDWKNNGQNIKLFEKSVIRNEQYFFREGITYTAVARGSIGGRLKERNTIFLDASPTVFPKKQKDFSNIMLYMNSRFVSYASRLLSPALQFKIGYMAKLPKPNEYFPQDISRVLVMLKKELLEIDPTEKNFKSIPIYHKGTSLFQNHLSTIRILEKINVEILTLEGVIEKTILDSHLIDENDVEEIMTETGEPVGWYPLVEDYDTIDLNIFNNIPLILEKFIETKKIVPKTREEIERIKEKLLFLYQAGQGSDLFKRDDKTHDFIEDTSNNDDNENDDEVYAGAYIPIPQNSFLEEISRNLRLHPISIHLLLEDIRKERDLICPSELRRYVEDYFSVTLLRMLGYRWPMQDESTNNHSSFFMKPDWIDEDGIISITPGTEETLVDRINHYLDEEFGAERGAEIGREAGNILGWKKGDEWGKQKPTTLERWFEKEFFKRHVSQFKKRPIAWHLTSPKGAFQAIVYYHKFDKDRLKLLRSRYVSETLKELRRQLGEAQNQSALDRRALNRAAELEEKIADVEEFDRRLGLLQEGRQREARIWVPWKSPAEQPVGWDPDINDGVRVNIAPLQRLGLLAADVLSKKDLDSLLAPEGR